MGLRDRLKHDGEPPHGSPPAKPPRSEEHSEEDRRRSSDYQQIKRTIHRQLIDHVDSSRMIIIESPETRRQVRGLLEQILHQENPPLNQEERRQLIDDLEHETFGLGPIEPLLRDTSVNDILVNRFDEVYVERYGKLERTQIIFRDNMHLMQVIERIVSRVGRRIDESNPMVDARLPDGSRVNAIIPPLAVDGPSLSIRRAKTNPIIMDEMLKLGSLNLPMAQLLQAAVKAKMNVLISGGSGSGKTTLLNAMVTFIPEGERLVSIEDTVELRLQGQHVVRLETRPPNIEGKGEITQRELIKNALRMRPDRVLVGEVRGPEAFDMLQAMNTGHKGSLATIHANSPRDALARMETMILLAGMNLTSEAMRRQISSAIDFVVQTQRFPDGVRRITSISEMAGMEGTIIKLQELAKFQYGRGTGFNTVRGDFVSSGVLPSCLEELQRTGVVLQTQWFIQAVERREGS
jgi:pilus assembly protein CpaF